MGIYSNLIFPRFYDRLMDKPFWGKYRREQLASVSGKILEIGVGTGLNLPHYPAHVNEIFTVDPNPGMNRRLQKRIDGSGIAVKKSVLGSEQLPFEEACFDCVVSTITLCSIQQADSAMSEIFRVLKPGGRLLFLEHGISPDQRVASWQKRLNPVQRWFADGCILTLDVQKVIGAKPFSDVTIDNFYMEDTPQTHGYMYRGQATK